MSDIQLFDIEGADTQFGVAADGRVFAVASGFAKALGYREARDATRLLDDDEKGTHVVATAGGSQRVSIIYEDGIWELIFRSSLPQAKAIKKRVKGILREIRENGGYLDPNRTAAQNERLAEMIKYREAKDMLTLATDYEPSSESARRAFTRIQDMFLYRVTGMHAPELRSSREIVTWTGKRGPTKADRAAAKNYLTPDELTQLSGYSDIAVGRIKVGYPRAGYTVAEFWDVVRRVALEG